MPICGNAVFDVDDVPAGHVGEGRVREGAVVHGGNLGRGCGCGPGEPENAVDLGCSKGGDGEGVNEVGLSWGERILSGLGPRKAAKVSGM